MDPRSLPIAWALAVGALFPAGRLAAADPPLAAALLLADPAPVPGSQVEVGVRLEPAPGWHTYGSNPGSSGMAPRLAWDLPPGWRAEPPVFPPARVFRDVGTTYGYDRAVLLAVRLIPPGDAPPGPVTVRLRLDALVCRESCVPVRFDLASTLDIGGPSAADPGIAAALAATRADLPLLGEASVQRLDAHALMATIAWPGAVPHLVPEAEGWLDDDADQQPVLLAERWHLRLVLLPGVAPPGRIAALITDGARHARIDLAVP